MASTDRPIIIKRVVEESAHAHHGGAWKVAYADFVTAMMAFFLLLWLVSTSTEETLKGLAEYFSESIMDEGPPGGMGGMLKGLTMAPEIGRVPTSPLNMQATAPFRDQASRTSNELNYADGDVGELGTPIELAEEELLDELERIERERFEQTKEAIERALDASDTLRRFEENLAIEQTPEGLRIELLDRQQAAMFPTGSDVMYPVLQRLLAVVVEAIAGLPNQVSIRGHTDAQPFLPGTDYDNWRLSSDRANATRVSLTKLGLDDGRVAEVVGKGASQPMIEDAPHDPRNRRISLVLLNQPRPTAVGPTGVDGNARAPRGDPARADPARGAVDVLRPTLLSPPATDRLDES